MPQLSSLVSFLRFSLVVRRGRFRRSVPGAAGSYAVVVAAVVAPLTGSASGGCRYLRPFAARVASDVGTFLFRRYARERISRWRHGGAIAERVVAAVTYYMGRIKRSHMICDAGYVPAQTRVCCTSPGLRGRVGSGRVGSDRAAGLGR